MFLPQAALNFARLKIDQWKSKDSLRELQEARFRALLSHARNVPYYSRLLSGGDVRGLDDLPLLPVLDKETLRARAGELTARGAGALKKLVTSGSSGLPLEFSISREDEIWRCSMLDFTMAEAGLMPLARFGFVTYEKPKPAPFAVFRASYLSIFNSEEDVLREISRQGLGIVRSYPSVLSLLARKNLESERRLRLRAVFSGAERLLPEARRYIQDSFGCRVRDFYGAIETGRIGWECEEGSMHALSDCMFLEVADEAGRPLPEGRSGRLLVTPLFQKAMPLFRYDVGDRAALGSGCSCGRSSAVIKSLEGRHASMLAMGSGRLCSSISLDIVIRHFPGILAFRGLQGGPGRLLLRVVATGEFDGSREAALKEKLSSCFPEPMEIAVERVGRLPEAGYKLSCVEPMAK